MSSFPEVVGLLVLAAVAGYWIEAMRSKELAQSAARRACRARELQFLDDTVQLVKLRLRRGGDGHRVVYREYRFEFTVDGAGRERGEIVLLGRHVLRLSLGAQRIWETLH
jgi:hypothetical protein